MKKAALLIAHGSRSARANREVADLARRLQASSGWDIFEHAFLEVASPDIPAGIKTCVDHGATHIMVLLHFLNSGSHVLKDIPAILDRARREYPRVRFNPTPFIGSRPEVEKMYLDIIRGEMPPRTS